MGFLSSVAALILEWFLAQVAKFGASKIHEFESELAARHKAEEDSQALVLAKDEASRVAALKEMTEDTFEDQADPDNKPTN